MIKDKMRHVLTLISCVLCSFSAEQVKAQRPDTVSRLALDSVEIKAYGSNRLITTAAAINKISARQLQRYSNTNILQAVNATAGVRLEERSLGSYRLNIRGSSVRSPYGVRNVKIYYNDIPFTAPGGNSMLNMLGFHDINALEIIKGPGGSLYGAGIGGVVLMESTGADTSASVVAGLGLGSFGALNYHLKLQATNYAIGYEDAQADGYRAHTEMRRKVANAQIHQKTFTGGQLSLYFMHSDLFYQTPGGLTLSEYQANPRQSRPSVGNNPSAVLAKASIHQKASFLGLKHQYLFSPKWSNTTSLYGFLNETENPAIQNYELKAEPHYGGRTNFIYRNGGLSTHFGAELQRGSFTSKTYRNLSGRRGAQLTDDELDLWQWLGFAQLNYHTKRWYFNLGASINNLQLDFLRSSETPNIQARKAFNGELQPRFAILYKANTHFSTYINVAKGFSPPASSEIFADNSTYNLALKPEQGWNIEPGLRWQLLDKRLSVDANYFYLLLSNAIVTRRTAEGANYYLNAGKTKQQGVEASLSYVLANNKPLNANLQLAYAYQHFKYDEFVQLQDDYSGNRLPGVAPHTYTLMLDAKYRNGLSAFLSYHYSSRIMLNDANSQYANSFQLVSLKLAYQKNFKNTAAHFFVGTDNLLNQTYSLGNDINGFGGRYYNVAPARSFYLGFKITLKNLNLPATR
jgi:iron complex outermembrane receptor protein